MHIAMKLHTDIDRPLALAAIGLESEFTLFVDGEQARPEDLFRDPRDFLRRPLMHRVGSSYHLPNGGAVYFDTGVVEVVTPAIELERGAAARAGRSLWENIHYLRDELDSWQARTGREIRLAGFSTHYNISMAARRRGGAPAERIEKLALLLTYILPAPVMLLAANRRSTGVGVRPRGTATLVAGIVREVAHWPSRRLEELVRRGLPRFAGFRPVPHTSRKGWLARQDCYPRNPFATGPDVPVWTVEGGAHAGEQRTLRQIAADVFGYFHRSIARIADPFTVRLLAAVMDGRAASLLDLPDRPPAYDDVGRLCRWTGPLPDAAVHRSRYERVLIQAIAGTPLHLAGEEYVPIGMRGWSRAVFRRTRDHAIQVFSVDSLLQYLDRWERSS